MDTLITVIVTFWVIVAVIGFLVRDVSRFNRTGKVFKHKWWRL